MFFKVSSLEKAKYPICFLSLYRDFITLELYKNVLIFHVDMPFYELLIEIIDSQIEGKTKTNILFIMF